MKNTKNQIKAHFGHYQYELAYTNNTVLIEKTNSIKINLSSQIDLMFRDEMAIESDQAFILEDITWEIGNLIRKKAPFALLDNLVSLKSELIYASILLGTIKDGDLTHEVLVAISDKSLSFYIYNPELRVEILRFVEYRSEMKLPCGIYTYTLYKDC